LIQYQISALRVADGHSAVNLIAGNLQGKESPVHSLTGVFMATWDSRPGGRVRFDGLAGRDVFLYVVRGEVTVAGTAVAAFNLAELAEGDAIVIEATMQATVIFGHADPIDGQVVSHGPFAMTPADEIRQAYADYGAGSFNVPS
jgi:redox-sensitive bicupin YhaK (pirin superfamily)